MGFRLMAAVLAAGVAAVAVAAHRAEDVTRAALPATGGWVEATTPNRSLALLLPPAYRALDRFASGRSTGCWKATAGSDDGGGSRFLCVGVVHRDDVRPLASGGGWLGRRGGVCSSSYLRGLQVHRETRAGRQTLTEAGRVSSNVLGLDPRPVVLAHIELGDGWWVRVSGEADDDAGARELLAIARTVRPGSGFDARPQPRDDTFPLP